MAIYSVYLPPEQSNKNAAEHFRLLRDAKAPLALIFPPLWLAWHRLWVELIVYFAIVLGISLLAAWKPLPPVLYLSAIPGLYLLLEGNELVRKKLERAGWRFAGVVDAQNLEEAEIKFVLENEGQLNLADETRNHPAAPKPSHAFSAPVPAGLFPE